MLAEADQQCFSPAGCLVDVIIVQLLHLFGLHFHHGGLGEHVTVLLGEVHHMHGSCGLTHLFANLGIGLCEVCECSESGLGHGDLVFSQG